MLFFAQASQRGSPIDKNILRRYTIEGRFVRQYQLRTFFNTKASHYESHTICLSGMNDFELKRKGCSYNFSLLQLIASCHQSDCSNHQRQEESCADDMHVTLYSSHWDPATFFQGMSTFFNAVSPMPMHPITFQTLTN